MTLKRTLFALIALLGALALYTAQLISTPKPPAHQVFLGGDVLTMDSDNTVAEAISVRAGVIDAVGIDADIAALITPATQVVRLEGRTLIPGFIDAHGHFPGSGQTAFTVDLNSPPIGDTRSITELLDKLRIFGAERPDGWLFPR